MLYSILPLGIFPICLFLYFDAFPKGPDSLSGPVGSTLSGDIWLLPVVAYQPISGKVPILPDKVVMDLSRDQQLAYQYSQAIQSGKKIKQH